MKFASAPVLVTGSMSGNIFSQPVNVSQAWAFSFQANYSGVDAASVAGLGNLKIQVSNDNPAFVMSGSGSSNIRNWADFPGGAPAGVAGSTSTVAGSSSMMLNCQNPGVNWARLAFVAASGSGIMSANYFGKDA